MSKTPIMGKAVATAEQMANYVLSVNPNPKTEIPILALAKLFLLAGEIEGVRGDLEFARSCHETGNFAFKATVTPDQKNFCGHGTVSATEKGSYFPDEFYSVLVQCQHAKGYATADPLNYTCLDDRYKWVKLGSAPNMEDMGGKWAVPGYDPNKYSSLTEAKKAADSYGDKIVKIMNKILAMPTTEKPVVTTTPTPSPAVKTLSGKKICIDAGHYGKYNRCPAIPEYYESEVMWKLHLLLKAKLESLGATVITTRANMNTDLDLKSRGKAAKGCDLFLSLHSNAVGSGMNESVDYVAAYHLTEDTKATCDDVSEDIARVLAPVIAKTMGTNQGYQVLTRKSSNDRNGDGMLNDNYYGVLHGARLVDVPGIILEHSFHTNTKAVKWLLVESNLDRLATAEAEALLSYFSGADTGSSALPYCIRVANVTQGDVLRIRKEPDNKAAETGSLVWNDPNKYTIVEERNGWGKLKSGIGWVYLKYTKKV